ncbi:hypothetical protein [Levilactobacillus bambusae]|uniref:Uncharacterized protein n=1 Tax=Levilactobacillus bambusae TaxID=2024736 RepID=A0A2V1N116_9LACO|nr:hypothetical protein [Levilactobacillus bambusae]PWG00981.1 hypothetical protein DCM90_02055 [Levilactobacillus bambusae]
MPVSELERLKQENAELRARLDESQKIPVWPVLREEIRQYCLGKDKSWPLQNAIYTVLRYNLNLPNINGINSTNIDQARETFEMLKKLIG